MNPPATYRVQDGCRNCRFVEVEMNYDDADVLYCNLAGDKAPEWDLVEVVDLPEDQRVAVYAAQDKFREDHAEVSARGKCDKWEAK
jgi:hypothetical protein